MNELTDDHAQEFERLLGRVHHIRDQRDFIALLRLFDFAGHTEQGTFAAIKAAKANLADEWGCSRRQVDLHVSKAGFKILIFLWAAYSYSINLGRCNPTLLAWRRSFTAEHDADMLRREYESCCDIFAELGQPE